MFTSPAWLEPRTAYVHIPFCGHHCGYCDFAVTAGRDHLIEPYLDALTLELERLGSPRPVESLFLGGGTPTYLTAEQLDRLFAQLDRWLPRVGSEPEVSIESTPESLTAEKAKVLAAHGVNRVSIGVQSFQAHLLTALDRRHGIADIPRAVDAVRKHLPVLSFDLIFAAPGQTNAEWDRDLEAALSFAPDHLSLYGLTYETGTPLWKDRKRGALKVVGEEEELSFYRRGIERLTAAGFEHYEVSNFALPGRQSIHNRRYWANEAYYGLGVGAARYVEGSRELNTRDIVAYIAKLTAGDDPTFQRETLGPRERAFETIAVQLRRSEGIGRKSFRIQTGFDVDDLTGDRIAFLVEQGLLEATADSLRLTSRGRELADGVTADLMKSLLTQHEPKASATDV